MMLVLLLAVSYGSLLVVMTNTITVNDDLKQEYLKSKDDIVKMVFNKAIPKDYDPEENPTNGTLVDASLKFLSIPSVQFRKMEIEVEFIFGATWKDDRLTFDEDEKHLSKYDWLKLPDVVKERLWAPGINFPECRHCNATYMTDQKLRTVWFSAANKELSFYFRDTMSFYCQYDLSFYPFDVHICNIVIELDDGDHLLKLNDSTSPDYQVWMPTEFAFDSLFVKLICPKRERSPNDVQCLRYSLRFHRIAAYYLMIVYTPSFLIVIISWFSFWLPTDASPARVALGLTSLLTLTTQFANAQKDLPPVAYVKALDVWMLTCVVMVFGSLLEFAAAHKIQFQSNKPLLKHKELKHPAPTRITKRVKLRAKSKKALAREAPIKGNQVNSLDAKARVVFPSVFILFNLIYWPYYGRGG